MKRLLDHDAESGITTLHHYDEMTDTTCIEEVQDPTPILERNKAIQNIGTDGKGLNAVSRAGIKDDLWHVARIPSLLIVKWRREHGIDIFKWGKCDWTTKRIKQLLNSREYQYLRTGTGRI